MRDPVVIPGQSMREATKFKNAVWVGPGSKWHNPFRIIGGDLYADVSTVPPFEDWAHIMTGKYSDERAKQLIDDLFQCWIARHVPAGYAPAIKKVQPPGFTLQEVTKELRGKDLVCDGRTWETVHAKYLLKIANR